MWFDKCWYVETGYRGRDQFSILKLTPVMIMIFLQAAHSIMLQVYCHTVCRVLPDTRTRPYSSAVEYKPQISTFTF